MIAESDKSPRGHSNNKKSSVAAKNTEPPKRIPITAKAERSFTFRELATATNNFHPDCIVGEGGFGRVYKGQLEDGQVYTIMIGGKYSSDKMLLTCLKLIQLFSNKCSGCSCQANGT